MNYKDENDFINDEDIKLKDTDMLDYESEHENLVYGDFDKTLYDNKNISVEKKIKEEKGSKIFFALIFLNLLLSVAVLGMTIVNGNVNSKSKDNKDDVSVSATIDNEYSDDKGDVNNDNVLKDDENDERNELNSEFSSVEDIKDFIKNHLSEGKGTNEMLRELYPENVIIYKDNKFLFVPVDDTLKKNDIDNEKLKVLEKGEIEYTDESSVSIKGIDVSKYQGDIDWKKVAGDGVKFAIIRLGYRGYGTGEIMLDEKAKKNIEEASKAGIKVGVYFFSQAINEKEAKEEAKFVLENIKGYDIDYPIVFDTEDVVGDNARANDLSVNARTQIAKTFCDYIKDNGYTPVIYANLRWFNLALDMKALEEYDKWYAYYDDEIYFPYKISMWQYSENGKVNGIEGSVDMNISFKEW